MQFLPNQYTASHVILGNLRYLKTEDHKIKHFNDFIHFNLRQERNSFYDLTCLIRNYFMNTENSLIDHGIY